MWSYDVIVWCDRVQETVHDVWSYDVIVWSYDVIVWCDRMQETVHDVWSYDVMITYMVKLGSYCIYQGS